MSEQNALVPPDIEYAGVSGQQCCAKPRACCCPPNYKNGWSLVAAICGIAGFVFSLSMFAEIDDILKCVLTSVFYFIGIIISIVFFIATVSRLCGYKGCFYAHSIWRAATYVYTGCREGCEGMTMYREGAFQDRDVLAYIFLDTLIPGWLIALTGSYLDNIRGYYKVVGLKIEHPAVLWLAIVGRPVMSLVQVIIALCNVYGKDGCNYLFKCLLVLGIVYIIILVIIWGFAFGDVIDCACPGFFKGTTTCKKMTG